MNEHHGESKQLCRATKGLTLAATDLRLTDWGEGSADSKPKKSTKGWKTVKWDDNLFEETILRSDERESGLETTAGISAKKAIETVQNGGLNAKEQLRMIAFVAWKTKWLKAIDSLYVKINDEQEHHRSITWRGVYPK